MKVLHKMLIKDGEIHMAIASKERILKVLSAYNPWWKTGVVNPKLTKTYKRFAFDEAMFWLEQTDLRRIVVLTGTRRVGKTTIQYQMIEHLLAKGVPPQKIVFISMDHPMLKLSEFQDILDCYHENIYAEQDVYYFFDEIQYAQDWDKWLKIIYDMQPDTQVIATGSARPALIKGNQESGAGRWNIIQVPTLSFYEYCALLQLELPDIPEGFSLTSFLDGSAQESRTIMMKLSQVQNYFIRYLQVGGFPELALADNDLLAQQIMRDDVVDKVLKRDLPSLYHIRNATELERIFLYLCSVSSEIVSLESIAKELNGVSRPTLENYIRYLESASLIYQSWPIDLSGKKVLKAKPKIYIADAAIRNAVLMDEGILTDAAEMGKVVETAVYKHVSSYFHRKALAVGYYRGGNKNKEIDVVVERINRPPVCIEVKYREGAPVSDDEAIITWSEKVELSIIVTKNVQDFGVHHTRNGSPIIRIPAFAFLYLLGHAEKHHAALFDETR